MAPLLVLLVAVTVIVVLVLTGVLQGDLERPQGEGSPTTEVTVIIGP